MRLRHLTPTLARWVAFWSHIDRMAYRSAMQEHFDAQGAKP